MPYTTKTLKVMADSTFYGIYSFHSSPDFPRRFMPRWAVCTAVFNDLKFLMFLQESLRSVRHSDFDLIPSSDLIVVLILHIICYLECNLGRSLQCAKWCSLARLSYQFTARSKFSADNMVSLAAKPTELHIKDRIHYRIPSVFVASMCLSRWNRDSEPILSSAIFFLMTLTKLLRTLRIPDRWQLSNLRELRTYSPLLVAFFRDGTVFFFL